MKSKIHELQKNRKNFVSKTIKTKISILGLSIFTICLASSLLLVSCSKDSEDTVAQNLVAETSDYTVTTLAGSTIGDELGIGAAAKFNGPVCMDYARGAIFVADYFNNKIKKITPTGEVTNYGGSPVVPFNSPYGVAMTFNGTLYVSETFSNKIRAISTDNIATDYAGGIAGDVVGTLSTARFNRPRGLFAVGNELFIVDAANHKIKKTININGVTTIVNVIGTTIGDENVAAV